MIIVKLQITDENAAILDSISDGKHRTEIIHKLLQQGLVERGIEWVPPPGRGKHIRNQNNSAQPAPESKD